jgi:hypothetical protein
MILCAFNLMIVVFVCLHSETLLYDQLRVAVKHFAVWTLVAGDAADARVMGTSWCHVFLHLASRNNENLVEQAVTELRAHKCPPLVSCEPVNIFTTDWLAGWPNDWPISLKSMMQSLSWAADSYSAN